MNGFTRRNTLFKTLLTTLLAAVSIASLAKGQSTLTTVGSCRLVTACTYAVVDGGGSPAGTISFTDTVTYYVNTPTSGTFTYTDASGEVHAKTFSGSFTLVDPNPTSIVGNYWSLTGTFTDGSGSFVRNIVVFTRSGRGGGTTLTDLGATVTFN